MGGLLTFLARGDHAILAAKISPGRPILAAKIGPGDHFFAIIGPGDHFWGGDRFWCDSSLFYPIVTLNDEDGWICME